MTSTSTLHELQNKYRLIGPSFSLQKLYTQALTKQREALNTIIQGTLLGLLGTSGKYVLDKTLIPPEVVTAFTEAFPNMELGSLVGKSTEYLDSLEQGWKGKLFEVVVRDKLNSGNAVGGLQLLDGQTAQLAALANQPEWDLQIIDQSGNAVDYLQLKATDSISYINSTLERYPDTTILTTAEIPVDEMVLSASDITDVSLELSVGEASEILSDGVFNSLDFAFSFGLVLLGKNLLKRGYNLNKIKKLIHTEQQKLNHLNQLQTKAN